VTCDEYLARRVKEMVPGGHGIFSRTAVGGGCINNAELLDAGAGAKFFLKRNRSALGGLFAAEAAGLEALQAGEPRVPRVLGLHDDGKEQLILLEYIPEGSKGPGFWERFGRELAALHRLTDSRGFGFSMNNHIGATEQRNPWMPDWLDFFARQRIGYQIDLARRTGVADSSMVRDCERFMTRIGQILIEPGSSSLLHGDLWGGNYMVDGTGAPVLIDPAVYYGHREADLAMTSLFGGFDSRFYQAYNEAWPLEPGYEERRDGYNLYHMLNHLNLFGGGYASSVRSILKRYL
jgi:fructosamine-3-kinase